VVGVGARCDEVVYADARCDEVVYVGERCDVGEAGDARCGEEADGVRYAVEQVVLVDVFRACRHRVYPQPVLHLGR
jgi:hypothetical protein